MKMYADSPGRRVRQIVTDLLFVMWCGAFVLIGFAVHSMIMDLEDPSTDASRSASGLADSLRDAGDVVGGIPLVGDEGAEPFEKGADAAEKMATAAEDGSQNVANLAVALGLYSGLVPLALIALQYLPRRATFVRNATAGQKYLDAREDLDLFALRALARQPMHVLAQISDDPAGDWRSGDPVLIERLAELELRDCGLTPPTRQQLAVAVQQEPAEPPVPEPALPPRSDTRPR